MQAAASKLIGASRLVLILLALMIALPAFVMGAEISHALGATRAVQAYLMGGAILGSIAAMTGAAGALKRCTTYELIADAFGRRGALVANSVLGFSLLGWYGVIATMFGHALAAVGTQLSAQPPWLLALAGCILTTATAMVGFKALNWLSMVTTPLKILLLAWTFGAALRGGFDALWAYVPATATPLGSGTSMVVGGLIVGAVLAPDVCRFVLTPRRAALGAGVAYGLGFPMVLILSGLPSLVSGERDMVNIMLALGLGVPAMLTVILTAWSTNAFNLYAATLVAETLAPRQPAWRLALGAGVIGTVMGLFGISDLLLPYLLWLSIAIPPIAGIYLVNVKLGNAGGADLWRFDALVSWVIGSGWTALAPRWDLALTPVAALDSILVSAVAYALLRWTLKRAVSGKAPSALVSARE